MTSNPSELPLHFCISEPELLFHPDRDSDTHSHPLIGLTQFGPYSRSLINRVIDPIRVAIIAPHKESNRVVDLLKELESTHKPKERRQYLPEFSGMSRIFGIRAVPGQDNTKIELPASVDEELNASDTPHLVLASKIISAIAKLQSSISEFDVVLIYLPERWSIGFYGPEGDDFDLHDYLKAVCAERALPIQVLLEDGVMQYFCRCSVMWRLSIALYCKAGGVPWKLAGATTETAYIGLSYAIRMNQQNGGRFVTCCSQVFDSDGAGLEFILYETDDVSIIRDNPFLSRGEMRRVMARSLALYQRRHAGRSPKQIVVHKSSEFKPEEIDGCFDAWQSAEGLDLIHVQQEVIWRGIKLEKPVNPVSNKGKPAAYPCERGSYAQIGTRDVLLWTQGNTRTVVGGKDYYKEGKGIPIPLMLRRYAGHGGWEQQCRNILGLTKMNWNNDGLYDRLPVTIGYAKILAKTVKRMSNLARRPYQLRFFM